MPISPEQRKLLTAVEDGIYAFLFAVLGAFSLSRKLMREPSRAVESLKGGDASSIVPQPLTYLAGASLMFLLSLRFARSFASFVFLRNFNSISFDLPLKEISVSACLLAVVPTVFGVFCLSWLVTWAAGPTKSSSAISTIMSLALGLELYLSSLSLIGGRLVTLLAVDHEVFAGVMAYAVLALMALAFIWPAVLSVKAAKVFFRPHCRWRLNLSSTAASVVTPAIALGAFLLQYGHAEFEPPQTTCVLSHTSLELSSQAIPIQVCHTPFGVAAILINRGPATIFVSPPRSSRFVNGRSVYEGSLMINFRKVELFWNWPEQQIVALEPEKSIVITGMAVLESKALESLQNGQAESRADLVTDLRVLTATGSDFSVGCVTNNVALR
jgi:hypothetical protein